MNNIKNTSQDRLDNYYLIKNIKLTPLSLTAVTADLVSPVTGPVMLKV